MAQKTVVPWVRADALKVGDVVANMADGRPYTFDVVALGESGEDVAVMLRPIPCGGSGEDVQEAVLAPSQVVYVVRRRMEV